MATSVNRGNQTLTFSFGEPALSIRWNRLNFKLHTPGIYDGGELEIVDDNTVRVNPFTCYIVDTPSVVGVRIQTFDPVDIDVTDVSKPYICIRFNWLQQGANFAEIAAFESGDITNDFIVVGKCEFNESNNLISFDYSRRDEITEKGVLSQLPFRVKSDLIESNEVVINGGVALTTENRVVVSDQALIIPDTTDGRYDFIFINNETGNIELYEGDDSPTPTMPSYAGRVVIAEIRREGTRTTVRGSEIINVDPDVELTALTGVTSDADGFVEISTLDPSRLVSTNASNKLESVDDLSAWFTETSGLSVTDNLDGTVTVGFEPTVTIDTLELGTLRSTGLNVEVDADLQLVAYDGFNRLLQTNDDGVIEAVFELSNWISSTTSNLIVEDDLEGKLELTVPLDLQVETINEVAIDQGVIFTSDVVFQQDVTILGDTTTVDTETLTVEDNLILINKGEVGPGVTKGFAGLLVDRGPYDDNYFLGFDENRNAFTLGEIAEESLAEVATTQVVATREDAPTEYGIPFWNNVERRFDTDEDFVISGDFLLVPYSLDIDGSTKDGGVLYRGTADPSETNRLNYDGNFHAFTFIANNGIQLGGSVNAVAGTLRWNAIEEQFEGYDGENWGLIGGEDLELGTAAFADLTENSTDTTEGRVLQVGDFGLGSTAINLTDTDNLDDITMTGFYYNSTNANTPGNNYPVDSAGSLLVIYRSINNITQRFSAFGAPLGVRVFERSRFVDDWTPWEEFYHTGNMPEVSQAEAEEGTLTELRAWTPERVRQAIEEAAGLAFDQDLNTTDDVQFNSMSSERIILGNYEMIFDSTTETLEFVYVG